MSTRLAPQGVRKHIRSERMKELAAAALAQQVGYLRAEDLPGTDIFDTLPTTTFNAHRIIRAKNELFLVIHGLVEIWHTHYDKLVSSLMAGALFGELPLLGQSMLGTKAITGTPGATVAVMDEAAALEWLKSDPTPILRMVGTRLVRVESEHYRSRFQLSDSRIAALLLRLAGEGSVITGMSHAEIGEKIGIYRETVTNILDAMKMEKLIEIGRKRVAILDRRALRELSEL